MSDARVGAAPPADATSGTSKRSRQRPSFGDTTRAVTNYRCIISSPANSGSTRTRWRRCRAYERVATAAADGGCHPYSAANAVADDGSTATVVGAVLEKHTGGLGILEDIFADQRVSDVFATAPVSDTRLRVRCDGETMRTNPPTPSGANALASTVRRSSGRAFS